MTPTPLPIHPHTMGDTWHPDERAAIISYGDERAKEARESHARIVELLDYVLQDDLHNRLTPRVIDIAYTSFMYGARGRNAEDGSQCDWFNDTKPVIDKVITKLRRDLFASQGGVK